MQWKTRRLRSVGIRAPLALGGEDEAASSRNKQRHHAQTSCALLRGGYTQVGDLLPARRPEWPAQDRETAARIATRPSEAGILLAARSRGGRPHLSRVLMTVAVVKLMTRDDQRHQKQARSDRPGVSPP